MKTLSSYKESLQKSSEEWAQHSSVTSTIAYMDKFVLLLRNKNYNGSNEAIASIYSPLRAAMFIVAAITLVTIIFGMLAPIESAAIARGSVAVISKRKTVQHLEGGIIKKILVEEGDVVKKDQPLLEISDVASKANREIIQGELLALKATEMRITALQEGKSELTFPEEMQKFAESRTDLGKTIQAQAELFATQYEGHKGKTNTLKQRIEGIKEEIAGLAAQSESSTKQLSLTEDEIKGVAELYEKGMATKPRLRDLQRRAQELKGNSGQYKASIAKAEQSITEAEMDIINLENEFSKQLAEELRDTRSKISDYEEKLRAANDVLERTVITAPSEGIVTGLKFHTIGGVIMAGAPIMDIVPQSDKLVLEVQVQPTDIDVVEPNMEARIVFSAYKSRRMPILSGKVTNVSADAFSEQQGVQNVTYYTARVEVDNEKIKELDEQIKLYPGMPVEVFINTGSRSFFSYMFAPVTDSFKKAFKEE